jgi:hypothetical protein
MFEIRVLLGLALPFILAAIAVALAWWTRKSGSEPSRRELALGVGAGFIAGAIALGWPPPFPPMEVADRTLWVALAATVFALVAAKAAWARWLGLALLASLVYVAILGPILADTSGTRKGLFWLVTVGLVVLASWASVEGLSERLEGAVLIWPLLVMAAGTSVVLIASHSVVLCLLGLALTSALAAPGVASWFWPLGRSVRGVIPIVLAVLTALVLNGHVYAFVPTSSALVLAAAPAASWSARLGPVRRRAPWVAVLAAVIATLVPVGVAVGLALVAAPPLYGE